MQRAICPELRQLTVAGPLAPHACCTVRPRQRAGQPLPCVLASLQPGFCAHRPQSADRLQGRPATRVLQRLATAASSQEDAATEGTPVEFIVPSFAVRFGQHLRVVGDAAQLGAWDAAAAPAADWSEGDTWRLAARLPPGAAVFKVVKVTGNPAAPYEWEAGNNRLLEVPPGGAGLRVTCRWGSPELQVEELGQPEAAPGEAARAAPAASTQPAAQQVEAAASEEQASRSEQPSSEVATEAEAPPSVAEAPPTVAEEAPASPPAEDAGQPEAPTKAAEPAVARTVAVVAAAEADAQQDGAEQLADAAGEGAGTERESEQGSESVAPAVEEERPNADAAAEGEESEAAEKGATVVPHTTASAGAAQAAAEGEESEAAEQGATVLPHGTSPAGAAQAEQAPPLPVVEAPTTTAELGARGGELLRGAHMAVARDGVVTFTFDDAGDEEDQDAGSLAASMYGDQLNGSMEKAVKQAGGGQRQGAKASR